MNAITRRIVLAAGLLGFLGVALGAFGAHALKATLLTTGYLDAWKTAVLYQLVHAVALLGLTGWREAPAGSLAKVAICWVGGVVCFSGSLYWLALGGPSKWLGPVTPLGGLALLAGWGVLIFSALQRPST